MERILVSMTPKNGAYGALSRAVSLAKRIPARVFVLFVLPPPEGDMPATPPLAEAEARRRLRLMIERAQAEGVPVECFFTEGVHEEEVIRFVADNKISLLVAENADGEAKTTSTEPNFLQNIRHRASCRVEVVSPRKDDTANLK